jgi:hypothetical protein
MLNSKFVFICAAGHSGSTLLDLLLGAHPEGASLGEITQLPKNIALNSICSCGHELSKCKFWAPLIADYGDSINQNLWEIPYALNLGYIRAGREIDPSHQTRARMMLRKLAYGAEYAHLRWQLPVPFFISRTIRQGAQNRRDFFRHILEHHGKEFIVDSSKHYIEAINLARAAPAETRIIWLLRDGRAVFNSGIRRGMSPRRALNTWARHCRRSARILRSALPEWSWLTVRYESLATQPELELRRLADFLGIEFHTKMLDFAAAESHIANGNRMRFGRISDIRLDEKWREELSAPMLRFFERHAGQLNRQLGYNE